MPAPETNEQLLDLIRKSGVVDEGRLNARLECLRAAGQLPPEPVRLATQLVRDGVLTHFQGEQFLQGKWRRFTIGKYKALERLGAGRQGSVYLCEHTSMHRLVAVKVLPASRAESPADLERFYREPRALTGLDHPNIVRAYHIDQDDTLHYLVMDLVDGSTLHDIVTNGGPMDIPRAAHYVCQAARALQHIHEANLVHRDIEPGNLMLDRHGRIKLIDFGSARFISKEDDLLRSRYDESLLGTADYLAPELAENSHRGDARADLYGLGAVLYFLLAGHPPKRRRSWLETPAELAAILDRMMAKNRDERYQAAREVIEALAPWTETPIPPPPEHEMPRHCPAVRELMTSGE
jgi:serine/threonine protein kinase